MINIFSTLKLANRKCIPYIHFCLKVNVSLCRRWSESLQDGYIKKWHNWMKSRVEERLRWSESLQDGYIKSGTIEWNLLRSTTCLWNVIASIRAESILKNSNNRTKEISRCCLYSLCLIMSYFLIWIVLIYFKDIKHVNQMRGLRCICCYG